MRKYRPERRSSVYRSSESRGYATFLGVCLAGTLVIPPTMTAVVSPQLYPDFAHALFGEENPTEQKIGDALQAAMGVDASVRCAPQWEGDDKKVVRGTTFPVLDVNLIRLHQEKICDKLSGDINDILSGTRFGVDVERKAGIVGAILTVAHEGAHARYDADSESITECQGFQDAPAVARALGATESSMETVLYMLPFRHNELTDEYMTTSDCVDGGPLDLYPDQVGGAFPKPGRLGEYPAV